MNPNQSHVKEELKPIGGAIFDPDRKNSEVNETVCYPDTRVDLLQRIKGWANDTEGTCIYWLQGMAGTGKSTISRTIIRDLIKEKKHHVASFFFRRVSIKGNVTLDPIVNPVHLFPTIAAQLVQCLPDLAKHVRSQISDVNVRTPVAELSRELQFQKLILEPLQKIDNHSKTPKTVIVVIDALDECDQSETNVKDILDVLPNMKNLRSTKVKFLVTSRPEDYICNKMGENRLQDNCEERKLHDEPATEDDISVFVKSRLKEFRGAPKSQEPLAGWPGEDKTMKLVKMTVPLFIFAATAC